MLGTPDTKPHRVVGSREWYSAKGGRGEGVGGGKPPPEPFICPDPDQCLHAFMLLNYSILEW